MTILLSVLSGMLILWTLYRWLSGSEEPRRLVIKWIATLALASIIFFILGLGATPQRAYIVPGIVALIGIIIGSIWAPNIGGSLAKPFTSIFDGGDEEIEPQPLYSIAINKMRKGEFQAAAFEIKE